MIFFKGNQGGGNFRAGLQNDVIPTALYSQTQIFLTGYIDLEAVDIHHVKWQYYQFATQLFLPMHFHSKNPAYVQLLPKSSSMHIINIRR